MDSLGSVWDRAVRENGDVKQTQWQVGEWEKLNVSRCSLSPRSDTVLLLSADVWPFFIVCAKKVLPNWPVDVSEIKEEEVSDEEVTGVQELPLELPAAEVAEQNVEGTPDDAVPEDGTSLVESPYKWVVEAANYLYPTCAPALSEALDMIESVSNRPLFLQLLLGCYSHPFYLSELIGSP